MKGNSHDVQNYFLSQDDTSCLTIDNLPDYSSLSRISLEPGKAYKFRVAGINSCGRGEWSEVSNIIIIILCFIYLSAKTKKNHINNTTYR